MKVDIALPCATQNELHLEDAKALVANGCYRSCEGANMPTTLEATEYLQENGVSLHLVKQLTLVVLQHPHLRCLRTASV